MKSFVKGIMSIFSVFPVTEYTAPEPDFRVHFIAVGDYLRQSMNKYEQKKK